MEQYAVEWREIVLADNEKLVGIYCNVGEHDYLTNIGFLVASYK